MQKCYLKYTGLKFKRDLLDYTNLISMKQKLVLMNCLGSALVYLHSNGCQDYFFLNEETLGKGDFFFFNRK